MSSRSKPSGRPDRKLEERDFTGGGIIGAPEFVGSTGDPDMDAQVSELVRKWDCTKSPALIEELLVTALNIGHDDIGVGDLKLLNRSLKELRSAMLGFRPYRHHRKVVVYGSARTDPEQPEFKAAMALSQTMLRHGFWTITGAGEGIMGAAQKGAGRDQSFGLNIRLPFEQSANETIHGDSKLHYFNYFFTRKLTFVKEADAVALFPGGFGTMDECFEVLTLMQTGKMQILPIVMVDAPGGTYWKTFLQFVKDHLLRLELISPQDLHFFKITDQLDEAVEEICGFYRVFHSYRFVGSRLVLRLENRITRKALDRINEEFGDLLKKGKFELKKALKAEANEPNIANLPRIVFTPLLKNFGRFRQLIDALNAAETEEKET